ncbi:MAG: hypothetical protein HKN21_15000, partial [Candidatus Eisenbacteria bacterium]|nr:hypothetical protein [Candidatus Eisenbacteria bacterium]
MTAKKADPTSEEALIQSWLSARAGVSIRKVWPGENLDAAFEGFSRDALRHARVNPPESVRAVEKVTASDRKNLAPANRIKLVRLYAHALSHAGQLKASDRHYRRAWDLSVKLNLREQIVFTGLGWTNILSLLGHYEEAKRIGHYAMSRLKNSERVLKARLSNNLGVVYHRWGKFEQAVTLLKESRRQLKALGFRYDFAYVTYTLGHSLLLQGEDLRFARKCIEEGRAYFAENKLHTLDLYARTALALADLSDGHYRKAMETLEELHDDLEKLGDKRATALILRQQAEFLG